MWAVTGVGNTAGSCKLRWDYNNWPKKGKDGTMTGVWDQPALAKESDGTWAVAFGTSNPDNAVYALNAVTGSRIWRFRTAQTGHRRTTVLRHPHGKLEDSAAVANGMLYFAANGTLYAYAPAG